MNLGQLIGADRGEKVLAERDRAREGRRSGAPAPEVRTISFADAERDDPPPPRVKHNGLTQSLRLALAGSASPMSFDQIAEAMGVADDLDARHRIRALVYELVKRKQCSREGPRKGSRYAITPLGLKVADAR
jgi:hypothetical protein